MEKEYQKLQEKYALPTLKNLDEDFQVSNIEEKKFLLKEITKKINEKIELFSNILEEITNPERLSSSHESSMFSDNEKKEVFKIYKILQQNHRYYILTEISYKEELTTKFIKEFFEIWQEIKPNLNKIVLKLKESWNHNKKSKIELGYFG